MPFKPVFEIGLWNAWIFALFLVVHPTVVKIMDRAIGTGNMNQKMGDEPAPGRQKLLQQVPMLLLITLFILSIFLPLRLGTPWLYLGLLVYLFGIAVFVSAIVTAVQTSPGQIFSRGVYRYSRHPMYLSFLMIFIGISAASVSWLFLLLSMGWMAFPLSQVGAEEQACMVTFGAEYQEYLRRTPKWVGLPKSR